MKSMRYYKKYIYINALEKYSLLFVLWKRVTGTFFINNFYEIFSIQLYEFRNVNLFNVYIYLSSPKYYLKPNPSQIYRTQK